MNIFFSYIVAFYSTQRRNRCVGFCVYLFIFNFRFLHAMLTSMCWIKSDNIRERKKFILV